MRCAGCLLLFLALVAGCGGGEEPSPPRPPQPPRAAEPPRATPTPSPGPKPGKVRRAHCAADAENCAVATGRVIYVEAVDPDGDGDAHYVLAGGRVTAPGLSVIGVARHLRPRRLPRPGELVSAAGPVFTGSYGQRQIEAVEIHHQRR